MSECVTFWEIFFNGLVGIFVVVVSALVMVGIAIVVGKALDLLFGNATVSVVGAMLALLLASIFMATICEYVTNEDSCYQSRLRENSIIRQMGE